MKSKDIHILIPTYKTVKALAVTLTNLTARAKKAAPEFLEI